MKVLVKEICLNGFFRDLTDKRIEIDITEEVGYTEYSGYEAVFKIDTTPLSPIINDIPVIFPLSGFVIETVDGTFAFSHIGWTRV